MLGWRHYVAALGLLALLVLGTSAGLNVVALRYAASNPSWLQALLLSDQHKEAERAQAYMQDHLSSLAIKVGELQAQMLRLDGLGEKLAKVAGLKPQELPSRSAGRGGAESAMPVRPWTLEEFSSVLSSMGREVEDRHDQLGVLEALLLEDSASRRFMPTLLPISNGTYSSNFGYRIDPFTGQNSFHEGVDFSGDSGTPIVAAASGKVVFSGWHPQYGRLVEVDHGNGLVSRYAHASQVLVSEGDLVVRGQRIAQVGSSGRATGPHLHFEVRLNGVPQNPVRFLGRAG